MGTPTILRLQVMMIFPCSPFFIILNTKSGKALENKNSGSPQPHLTGRKMHTQTNIYTSNNYIERDSTETSALGFVIVWQRSFDSKYARTKKHNPYQNQQTKCRIRSHIMNNCNLTVKLRNKIRAINAANH